MLIQSRIEGERWQSTQWYKECIIAIQELERKFRGSDMLKSVMASPLEINECFKKIFD